MKMTSKGRSWRHCRKNFILSVVVSCGRASFPQSLQTASGGWFRHTPASTEAGQGRAPFIGEKQTTLKPFLPLGWAWLGLSQLVRAAVRSGRSPAQKSGRDKVQRRARLRGPLGFDPLPRGLASRPSGHSSRLFS